jgi:ribonuclease VapC
MILDTSAVVAVFVKEPGFEDLLGKLAAARSAGIGTPTLVETGIVLTARLRRDAAPLRLRFLQEFSVTSVPFGAAHWREALDAYDRFGKGRHPAALNFGDCLTYATARLAEQPVLCVGHEFGRAGLTLA